MVSVTLDSSISGPSPSALMGMEMWLDGSSGSAATVFTYKVAAPAVPVCAGGTGVGCLVVEAEGADDGPLVPLGQLLHFSTFRLTAA
jgi:hypothetical protein